MNQAKLTSMFFLWLRDSNMETFTADTFRTWLLTNKIALKDPAHQIGSIMRDWQKNELAYPKGLTPSTTPSNHHRRILVWMPYWTKEESS